jgi:phosphatidylserine/phosphatidylglycerophosphate/cardiolipin synthase-like enzyme
MVKARIGLAALAIALMAPAAAHADMTRTGVAGANTGPGTKIDVTTTIGQTEFYDTHIADHLVGLIDRAQGAIYTNIYTAESDDPVRAALVRAKGRGVKVWVTYDGGENDPDPNDPISDAEFDWVNITGGERRLTRCPDGCHREAAGGRAHSKFFVFDSTQHYVATTPRGPAVWIGSANLTRGSGLRASNMAITFYNDTVMHSRMRDVFWDGFNHFERFDLNNPSNTDYDYYHPQLGWNDRYSGVVFSDQADSVAHISPDRIGGDMWIDQFNPVYPEGAPCTIRIAQAQITDERMDLVDKIWDLANRGCQVRVMLGQKSDTDTSADIGTNARAKLCNAANGRVLMRKRERMHEKGASIIGMYEGIAGRKQVFMGSHNWTGPALRWNDEVLLRVADSADAYTAFYDHFNALWFSLPENPNTDHKTSRLSGCAGG